MFCELRVFHFKPARTVFLFSLMNYFQDVTAAQYFAKASKAKTFKQDNKQCFHSRQNSIKLI